MNTHEECAEFFQSTKAATLPGQHTLASNDPAREVVPEKCFSPGDSWIHDVFQPRPVQELFDPDDSDGVPTHMMHVPKLLRPFACVHDLTLMSSSSRILLQCGKKPVQSLPAAKVETVNLYRQMLCFLRRYRQPRPQGC